MALKSSREGLRKELVDYLGNLIIDDNLKNEIIKLIGANFVTNDSLNNSVNSLETQITTESSERINADTILQNNINAESTARQEAISTIESLINNGTLKTDLLWTNASPKGEFASQTINLDLSQYKAVIIQATWLVTWTLDKTSIVEFMLLKNEQYLLNGAFNTLAMRKVIVGESNIQFDNAYYFTSLNSDNTTSLNELLVPKRIYGVR